MKRYERNYERLVEQKMKDVFISYKSEEVVWANWVKESLENAGITCRIGA